MRRLNRFLCDLNRPLSLSRWGVFACVFAMHFATASAWAQKPATLPGIDGGVVQWVVAGGILLIMCVAGFLNPKRSHKG